MTSTHETWRNTLIFIALTTILVIAFLSDIVFGSVNIGIREIFWSNSEIYREILWNFRLPKAITALVTGAAISVAGLIMQTLFRNPLADPYVLGVSSGASLGVAIMLMAGGLMPVFFVQSGWGLILSAIIGATLVLLLILSVSFKVKKSVSLLIIGIMFGQIAGSIVTIIQNQSNPEALKLFVTWTFGSLQAVSWNYLMLMTPIVLLGLTIVFLIQKPLNGLLLGENYAQSLGISIVKTRVLIIIAVALLAGATTAFTGPIAFIGLAVPHLARGIFRLSNHKTTIPATIICGATLLIICDLGTTIISPEGYILPINAISTLIGAPVVVWIILKNRKI